MFIFHFNCFTDGFLNSVVSNLFCSVPVGWIDTLNSYIFSPIFYFIIFFFFALSHKLYILDLIFQTFSWLLYFCCHVLHPCGFFLVSGTLLFDSILFLFHVSIPLFLWAYCYLLEKFFSPTVLLSSSLFYSLSFVLETFFKWLVILRVWDKNSDLAALRTYVELVD